MKTEDLTTEWLINKLPMSDSDREIFSRAVSSRGKYRGYLRASPPDRRKDPAGYAAWSVWVSNLAPMRVSIGALLLDSEVSGEFNRLDGALSACFKTPALMIQLLNRMEPRYRWNAN